MTEPVYRVTQVTDDAEITTFSGSYQEPSIEIGQAPRAKFVVPLVGTTMSRLATGKEILIERNGSSVFPGIIETPTGEKSASQKGTVTVDTIHKGYHFLRRFICTSYDYEESGGPVNINEGVTVNSWERFILYKPDGDVDFLGSTQPVHGINKADCVRSVLGNRLVYQHDFLDNSHLLPSVVASNPGVLQVYRDGQSGDLRPSLQRVRSANIFRSSLPVESIPIMNNDPNVSPMGLIRSLRVIIIGVRNGANPTIAYTADARELAGARSYTDIPLGFELDYNGTGLTAWTGTFTPADAQGPSVNGVPHASLGWKMDFDSPNTVDTSKLYYMCVIADLVQTTGLTEGIIEDYADPLPPLQGTWAYSRNWMETDTETFTGLEAMEQFQSLTVSDPDLNVSPHWDLWVDADLAVHFQQRRGNDIDREYSFAAGNIAQLSHEYYGGELAYQTIGIGAGSGIAKTRIVSREEFAFGGLYDADRDPARSARLYGDGPRQLQFIDSNEADPGSLYTKTLAFHKTHRDPRETLQIELVGDYSPYFHAGDGIHIREVETLTNSIQRVVELSRAWSGSSREKTTIRLGDKEKSFVGRLVANQRQTEIQSVRQQPNSDSSGAGGPGVYFDKDNYGIFAFPIVDGSACARVWLDMATMPWQAPLQFTSSEAEADPTPLLAHSAVYSVPANDVVEVGVDLAVNTEYDIRVRFSPQTDFTGRVFPFALLQDSNGNTIAQAEDPVDSWHGPWEFTLHGQTGTGAGIPSVIAALQNDTGTARSFRIQIRTLARNVVPAGVSHGISQFRGDTPGATPVYGTGIEFAVDPTLDANGIPSDWAADRHPMSFGTSISPVAQSDVDVLGYLDTETTSGVTKTGVHRVFFKGAVGTNNTQGLGVVSVSPFVEYRRV